MSPMGVKVAEPRARPGHRMSVIGDCPRFLSSVACDSPFSPFLEERI
jgi:hypothetical protein